MTPVRGPDGRRWPSVTAAARELGCSHTALYARAAWAADGWALDSYPDAANVGRRGGARTAEGWRRREEPPPCSP